MLNVTERAKQELKRILSSKVDHQLAALRLVATSAGEFGLSIDMEAECDQVVEHAGSKVLLVEDRLATRLEGVTFDVEHTPEGPNLVLFKES